MRLYRYRIGLSEYYGEMISEGVLARSMNFGVGELSFRHVGIEDMLADVELLAPVKPTKIVCIGRNYREHAAELGNTAPEERPLFFLKPPSALIASGEAIVIPPGTERVDFEGEIALVIGKRCRNVDASESYDYLYGVTAFNDVTARDWQKGDGQWSRAKGCDTFAPCGPYVDTSAAEALRISRELGKAGKRRVPLTVTTRVNGEQRQHGSSDELTFNFASLISYVSQYMTLEPGDLIATGTPAGVGPLAEGDEVAVELNCGPRLVNTVQRASAAQSAE